MNAITDVNQELAQILNSLEKCTAEDEISDDLVSQLHEAMFKRQILLQDLTEAEGGTDRVFLEAQLALSGQYLERVKKLQDHRQQLLHAGSKSKRQLNVYKTIDANR